MKINSRNIIKPEFSINKNQVQKKNAGASFNGAYAAPAPFVYPVSKAQINSNIPVSYKQIGEIKVPGLKDSARIYKLANGQRIITASKKGPIVVRTVYNTGSLNEPDNKRGISHFIEHNLFNGSRNLKPKEYDLKVSDLGGETNASTGFAATDYYLKIQPVNDNALEEALKLNAEQTQFPLFPNEQLIKEKEPVKSEIDMCADSPEDAAVCTALKNLFKIKTSSENFVIGTKNNINSLTRSDVLDYFNTWYTPDNAVTVITGNIDHNEAASLAAKYFNKQNDYSNIQKRFYEPVEYIDKPVREDIIKSNAEQPSITAAFAVKEGTPDTEIDKLDVLFGLMNLKNSGFYKAMDKLGVSFDIVKENMQNKPQGAKAVLITLSAPEDKLETALKTLYDQIREISNNTPDYKDVINVKKSIINSIYASAENSKDLNSLLSDAVMNNNYSCFTSKINTVSNITPEDISKTAAKYLDLNKVSICVSHHKDADAALINRNYSGARSVSFGAKIKPADILKEENASVKQFKLSNGIESTVIEGNMAAKSAVILDLKTDELNKTSSAAFMVLNEMLARGSSLNDAESFNKILDEKDISISLSAGLDGLNAVLDCSTDEIKDAAELLKEKLMHPNLTQKEFERAKQLVKEAVDAESISAFDKLHQELHPELGIYKDKKTRLKELEALKLSDIQALYSRIIYSSSLHALMCAPYSSNPELTSLFNNELASIPLNFKPFSLKKAAQYNIYKPLKEEKILTEAREQSQAEIVQGFKFKKSDNIDDIAKINLLNIILGAGGMSSRLFLDLREDKKLAYSVKSGLYYEKDTGVLYLKIGTTTQSPDFKEGSPENVLKSIEGFRRNVNLLKTQKVSVKELEAAKIKYKTAVLNSLETNILKSHVYADAKNSYYGMKVNEKLFEAIDKITPDDIMQTADYVFKNPSVISIAAGRTTLEKLKIGL